MTKRFTKCDTIIRDNGEEMSQAEVRDMLNAQHETITTLTSALKELKEIGDYQEDRIKELTEENEQLKQQMQRLYNYFADWFDDRMPPSDFSEMWDFVKEDEKGD